MTRNGLRLPLPALALLLLAPLALGQSLQQDLERIQRSAKIDGAAVAWSVRWLDHDPDAAGTLLAAYDPERALIPASNMKLLTTGAALRVLGADYVFNTEIGLSGTALVVKGAGDPALADPELLERMSPPLTVDDVLGVLAGAIADAGVDTVSALVVDDRVFDREHVHEGWPADQLDKQYCAQVAGLNFHTNVLRVFVAPGAGAGSTAVVTTQPEATWLHIDNRTRTGTSGANTIWPTRTMGTNDFIVHGQVVRKSYAPLEVTVDEPAMLFGRLLADHLEDRGVTIDAGVRLAEPAESLPLDRVLARVTTSMADILTRCNQDSKNLYAEALIKLVGHTVTGEPGSWTNGPAVMRMLIGELVGPQAAAATTISDGSGLSRDNRVSPDLLSRWLEIMTEQDGAQLYVDSLATPGEGTLRRRFLDGSRRSTIDNDLRAKSGYINGVRSLSGYVLDPDTGKGVSFSFLINDLKPGEQDRAARDFIDDAVEQIDDYLSARINATANVPGD